LESHIIEEVYKHSVNLNAVYRDDNVATPLRPLD
jgi:hypothetical protein